MSDYEYNNPPVGGNEPEQPAEPNENVETTANVEGTYHMRGANGDETYVPSGLRFGPGGQQNQSYQAPRQNQEYDPYGAAGTTRQNTGYDPYGNGAASQQNAGYYGSQNGGGYQAPYSQNAGYQANTGYQNPYQTGVDGNQSSQEPKKNKKTKKSGIRTIIAVAFVCILVGALVGGGVMYLVGHVTSAEGTVAAENLPIEESVTEIGGEVEAAEEEPTAFNSTTIEITTNSESTNMTPKDVYENYVNAVVAIANEGTSTNIFGQVSATASTGSGMIISSDGYILTNNHVVEDAEKLTVTMTSGEEYEATLIGGDSDNDVALIKIEGTDFPTVSIGDSDEIQVGDQLCAIGNPLGELTNTLTVGYVSALDREINENGIPINMFQTDCAINSGNSGGPIFDMNGNVIGITTAKYSTSSSYSASIEGIGFCIPINDAMDIVSDLLQYGYVRGRVSMGIMCQAISATVTQYYNLPAGIYVSYVDAGSAAETAGLKQGDIICAIDSTETTSVTELKVLLKEYSPGDTATLTVYQNETRQIVEMEITFDEMVSTTTTDEEEETESETQESQTQQQTPGGTQINPYFPFG